MGSVYSSTDVSVDVGSGSAAAQPAAKPDPHRYRFAFLEKAKPSALQVRKMKTYIAALQPKKAGVLAKEDLVAFSQLFVKSTKLSAERAKHALAQRQRASDLLFQPGDFDGKLDATLLATRLAQAGRDKVIAYVTLNFAVSFDSVDVGLTGYIDVKQLGVIHQVFGVKDVKVTESLFLTLDEDKDGKISFKEYLEAGIDFFLSDDIKSPHNDLCGKLLD